MLDDCREVLRGRRVPARASTRTRPTRPSSTRSLALLEQQKPLLRKYTDDDIGDMTSGYAVDRPTPGRATGYQMIDDKPNVKYVIPSEGAIRGSDTMVVLVRRAAPDRGQPLDQLQPRRPDQRREHELHRLHGPERGRAAVHRPGDPGRPDV